MRIKEIISAHRRDFKAIYECEHCAYEMRTYGYDDDNFHNNVIPNMECKGCGKTSEGKVTSVKKVPSHVII